MRTRRTGYQQIYLLAMAAIVLGLAHRAAVAEVVYTPVNVVLTKGHYNLDLNHDGIADFEIKATHSIDYCGGLSASLRVALVTGNGVEGSSTVAALASGSLIGPDQMFKTSGTPLIESVRYGYFEICGSTRCGECFFMNFRNGNWLNVSGFLGLEFLIDGQIHYGWAQMTVHFDPTQKLLSATLTGYAYETVAERSIVAGQNTGTYTPSASY